MIFVSDIRTWLQAIALTEVITVDKLGSAATIRSGQLALVYGVPYLVSGLMAVASRLQGDSELPIWAIVALAILGAVLVFVGVVLAGYLVREFQDRLKAEHDAEVYFARLIALEPTHFLPKIE